MKNISEMSVEEFNKMFPVEHCAKHGAYRAVCMSCEKEADAWMDWQEYKQAWSEETNRRER